ncbi:hypothetical protein F2Q69_00045081 [Brassica cretica]|uniref:Uncharacterized protein n=1 Tax=Brassica cretica TaxID=69181 RepID=A0A8S9NS36_BRACR|nr:hypothetical protein F2Q69_00045081 [Brassica cretica]
MYKDLTSLPAGHSNPELYCNDPIPPSPLLSPTPPFSPSFPPSPPSFPPSPSSKIHKLRKRERKREKKKKKGESSAELVAGASTRQDVVKLVTTIIRNQR